MEPEPGDPHNLAGEPSPRRVDPFTIAVYTVLVFVFVVLFAMMFRVLPAGAQQPQCAPAVELERQLSDQYKETPRWLGRIPSGGGMFFLTMAPDGETWTIYIRRQDGIACLLAAGVKGAFIDGPKGETF